MRSGLRSCALVGFAVAMGVVLAVMLAQTVGTTTATAASAQGGSTPSAIVIVCSPDSGDSNETCAATVGGGGGSVVPTGTVSFTADANAGGAFPSGSSCVVSTDSGGQTATCSVTYTPQVTAGTEIAITGTYEGDGTFAPAIGSPTAALTSGNDQTSGWTPSDGTEGGDSGTSTLPEFDLINLNQGSDGDSITAMDMSSGIYSGTAEVSGTDFDDNGVVNGNMGVHQLTCCGGYDSTNAIQFYLQPNNDLTVVGVWYGGTYTTDLGQVAGRATPTETMTCTAGAGGQDSCTETVTGSDGTPTGNATFSDLAGGTFSPSNACQLSGGSCSVTYTPPAGGSGSSGVSAVYSGDPTYDWAQAAASQTNATTTTSGTTTTTTTSKRATAVQVLCNDLNPGEAGDYDQCTATVGGTNGAAGVPTGSVTFTVNPGAGGGFPYGPTCTLAPGSASTATCSVDYGPAAAIETAVPVTATYSGDANFSSSSAGTQLGGFDDSGQALVGENADGQYVLLQAAYGLPAGTVLNTTSCFASNPAAGGTQAQRRSREVIARPAYNNTHPNPVNNGGQGLLSYCAVNATTNVGQFSGFVIKTAGALTATVGTVVGGLSAAVASANPVTGYAIAAGTFPAAAAAGYGTYTVGDALQSASATTQQDPPDYDYTAIAQPASVLVPHFNLGKGQAALTSKFNALILDERHISAVATAYTTTLNRAGGARLKNALAYEGLQTRAAVAYAQTLETELNYAAANNATVLKAVAKLPSLRSANFTKLAGRLRASLPKTVTKKERLALLRIGVPADRVSAVIKTLRGTRTAVDPLTVADTTNVTLMYSHAAKMFQYYTYDPQVIAAAALR
jgi:hypothetical protein